MKAAARCALLAAGLAACASPVPFPVVPAWDEPGAAAALADDERTLWAEATTGLGKLETDALVEDEALLRYLDSVLAALLPPVAPEMPPSRVRVLRTAERNAAALPDGTVLISTSFLAALADEAQLAALLGHELAHLLRRHSLVEHRFERLSGSTVRRMELSRALEDEADAVGLALVERAGYEPRAVLEMLERIAEDDSAGRGRYPQFESHPFVPERMRALRGKIPRRAPEQGRRDAARYEAAVTDLLLDAAEQELDAGNLARAEAAIQRHLRLRPDSGRGWYLEAERERRSAREGRRAPAARRAYERAVELAPDDPDALRALGFLCRESGETARARELLGAYLRAAPDAPDRKWIERYLREGGAATAEVGANP